MQVLEGTEERAASWQDVHEKCIARRPQPLSPDTFEKRLKERAFTNGADQDVVVSLYKKVFVDVFSQVEELDFSGLGWTNVDELVETLQDASSNTAGEGVCPNLKLVWLFNNEFSDPAGIKDQLMSALGEDVLICGLEPADGETS